MQSLHGSSRLEAVSWQTLAITVLLHFLFYFQSAFLCVTSVMFSTSPRSPKLFVTIMIKQLCVVSISLLAQPAADLGLAGETHAGRDAEPCKLRRLRLRRLSRLRLQAKTMRRFLFIHIHIFKGTSTIQWLAAVFSLLLINLRGRSNAPPAGRRLSS